MFRVPSYYCGFGYVSYFLILHTTLGNATYTGRLQYLSDIEQCKVAQNVMPMGLEGKADEEAESAVRGTSMYAVS